MIYHINMYIHTNINTLCVCKHINKYYIFRTWFIIFTMFMQNSLYWIKVIVSLLINDYIVPDYPFSFWNILFTKIQVKNINSLQMILVVLSILSKMAWNVLSIVVILHFVFTFRKTLCQGRLITNGSSTQGSVPATGTASKT